MKKILILFCCGSLAISSLAQTSYYKGEWTTLNSTDLFTGIFKIDIGKDNTVSGTLVWTYISVDSSKSEMVDLYKGKKGKKGIEYVSGTYNPLTRDMSFEGNKKDDPDNVIGVDKYSLKLSTDRSTLYGTTNHGGTNDGFFLARKIDRAIAEKQINADKRILDKKYKSL